MTARPNHRLLKIEAKIAEIKAELDRFQEAARHANEKPMSRIYRRVLAGHDPAASEVFVFISARQRRTKVPVRTTSVQKSNQGELLWMK
jgi:hypothetical protein